MIRLGHVRTFVNANAVSGDVYRGFLNLGSLKASAFQQQIFPVPRHDTSHKND
jgi:hypothetical protein